MPVAVVTPVLASGLLPMFVTATAPPTTEQAAQMWARAYSDYALAGGIPDGKTRIPAFARALANAFNPELGGAGPALFVQAFQVFWLGLSVPAQLGVVTAFVPSHPNVNNPQPPNATPQNQANGLAKIIARLTLGAVKVTVPPGVIAPLL